MELIFLIKQLFTGHYNLYNVDLVGAKTGKRLTQAEAWKNYWVNWVLTKTTILSGIVLLGFVYATIIKLLLKIWN